MKGEEIIIELQKDGVSLNNELKLPYSSTSLPTNALTFRRFPIYWRIRILGYDKVYQYLSVEVINYDEDHYYSLNQQTFPFRINQLNFDHFNWAMLKPLLSQYKFEILQNFLSDYNKDHLKDKKSNAIAIDKEPQEHKIEEFSLNVNVLFENATFQKGKVAFRTPLYNIIRSLEIHHPFLKEEFDYIKKWFAKKFKRDFFIVQLKGKRQGDKILEIHTDSRDISLINKEYIEDIQVIYLEEEVREILAKSSKQTIPLDEVTKKGKPLFPDISQPIDILQKIIRVLNIRNERELEFLSSHLNVEVEKIRMSPKPQDGFVFSFLVKDQRVFVWELLRSNATYIWTFKTKISYDEMIRHLDHDISLIQDPNVGRHNFKTNFKLQEKEYVFKDISHNLKDEFGFEQWKSKVQPYLLVS